MAGRESDNILCYLVHRTLYGELVTQLNDHEGSVAHLVCDRNLIKAGIPVIYVEIEDNCVALCLGGVRTFVCLDLNNQIDYGSKLLNLSLVDDAVIWYIKNVIKQAGVAK